jgi:hypothetical protein
MDWDAAVFHWEQALRGEAETRKQKADISKESRLVYARQAGAVVRQAMHDGGSRWSVTLPRPPWATAGMLDLGSYYTLRLGERSPTNEPSGLFRELPRGVQDLGGTCFDVRGIIQLNATNLVTIHVDRACQRLHFLQAASKAVLGVRVPAGRYEVTYASGVKVPMRLQAPDDVPPYWANPFHAVSGPVWLGTSPELTCTLAWSGCTPKPGRHKEPLFLTRTTWQLPASHQGEIVKTIELQASSADYAPLVFAITAE